MKCPVATYNNLLFWALLSMVYLFSYIIEYSKNRKKRVKYGKINTDRQSRMA